MRIGVMPLARPTFDVAFAEEVKGRALLRLEQEGFELAGPRALLFDAPAAEGALSRLAGERLDLLLLLQVTFTDASMTVRIAAESEAPLGLWAFPEARLGGRLRLNGFCGLNLAAHALGRAGRPAGYLYAAPDAPELRGALHAMAKGGGRSPTRRSETDAPVAPDRAAAARANHVLARLSGRRIGLVGEHPAGFDTCRYDPDSLERLAGMKVERIPLPALFDRARSVPSDRIEATRRQTAQRLAGLESVDQDQLGRSFQVHAALEDLARERRLAGLAVRCWPEMFTEFGCAACGPMAMLSDAGVPCACEADVYGAVTSLLLQELAGEPAFLVDLVDLDPKTDTAVVWHCGLAPLSMADPDERPSATVHSNRRMPLLSEFALKPGRITVARLSQALNQPKLVLAGGEVLKAPKSFTGTSGVLRFDEPAGTVMDRLLAEGIEHHVSLVYGEHRPALRALAHRLTLPVLELG